MPQEVGSSVLLLMVAACAHADLPVDGLCSGLPFSLEALKDHLFRVDWEDFTIFLDRCLEAAGSPEALEALAAEGVRLMVPPTDDLKAFLDLRTFFIWLVSTSTRTEHTALQTTVKLGGNGLIVCEHHIPPPYRPCRALAIASLGMFRGVPRILGLPDADVSCTFDDRCGLYLVRLPDVSIGGPRPSTAEVLPGIQRHLEDAGRQILSQAERFPWLAETSHELLRAESLEGLARRVGELLSAHCGCASGRIYIRGTEGDMSQIHAWGPGFKAAGVRMLTLGTRILGRVEVDHPEPLEQNAQPELLAWASIGIDRLLGGLRPPVKREVYSSFTDGLDLTARQKQVLFLLVQGLADKEIAHALGTSPKTVGHQVQALLHRSGAANRTALANLCLAGSGLSGASPEHGIR